MLESLVQFVLGGSALVRSRGTSQRSYSVPFGNEQYDFVREGNVLAARVCLLVILAISIGGRILVEQPGGTAFEYFPRWQWIVQTFKVTSIVWIVLFVWQ